MNNLEKILQEETSLQLRGRDLLSLDDLSSEEVAQVLRVAAVLKKMQKARQPHPVLLGKTLGMIFQKASTRTRISFEVAMYQLGGHALFLSGQDLQLGRGEAVPDTARVMTRYLDGIMIRTFSQQMVETLAENADIPVINALTDYEHPCQVLADLQTIQEHKGRLVGLKMAYIGDGNNMAHSLLLGAVKTGMNVAVASPEDYLPQASVTERAKEIAAEYGGQVLITSDPVEAVNNADVVLTDVWASMGQESEQKIREKAFAGYQVNAELTAHAKKDYLFLHCLPAHRGEEVSADIIDGSHSAIFDEAENRLHAQKAVLALLMNN